MAFLFWMHLTTFTEKLLHNPCQLGFLASLLGAAIGGIYFLVLIYAILTEGFVSLSSPPPFVQLIGGVVTFFTVPVLVILFTAIRYAN